MRTVKKPEVRKQEILAGALEVFQEKGYEKTTIGDIAKALGISQGLCYRYFTSKEEIYDAVIDVFAERIAQENLKNRPQKQPIRQWIQDIPKMLKGMEQAELEQRQLYALLHDARNQKMHNALCWKVGEKLLPAVTEVLEQAKAAGEIRVEDCQKAAAFGLYGEIGLLITLGTEASEAIQGNWCRLLGINE